MIDFTKLFFGIVIDTILLNVKLYAKITVYIFNNNRVMN